MISKLPEPPKINEPDHFDNQADIFVNALPVMVEQINEALEQIERAKKELKTRLDNFPNLEEILLKTEFEEFKIEQIKKEANSKGLYYPTDKFPQYYNKLVISLFCEGYFSYGNAISGIQIFDLEGNKLNIKHASAVAKTDVSIIYTKEEFLESEATIIPQDYVLQDGELLLKATTTNVFENNGYYYLWYAFKEFVDNSWQTFWLASTAANTIKIELSKPISKIDFYAKDSVNRDGIKQITPSIYVDDFLFKKYPTYVCNTAYKTTNTIKFFENGELI